MSWHNVLFSSAIKKLQRANTPQTSLHEQGFILIIILLLLGTMAMMVSHLLAMYPLQTQTTKFLLEESQCFEAAEAGLQIGEKKLLQLIQDNKADGNQPLDLGSIYYAGYRVDLKAIQLPKRFCMVPSNRTGHYYELQAYSQHASRLVPQLSLKKYFKLPDGGTCPLRLTKRSEGSSAWCQI